MSTLSNKLVAACMVTVISMVMYGCGGGGSSSSSSTDGMTGGGMDMCPAGQVGTPPDMCMEPAPPGPTYDGPKTATAIDAYGMETEKNMPEVDSVHRAVDGTLTFEDDDEPNTADDPNLLSVGEDPAPSVGADGWMGSRVTKSVGDMAPEAGIVYTNIGAPEEMKFMRSASELAEDAGETDDDDVSIVINTNGATAFSMDTELMGTHNGVPGTFKCTASTCAIETNSEMDAPANDISSLSEWTFESTNNVDSEADQATDYLYFGAWLTTPEEGAYMFKAFSGGDIEWGGDASSLEGPATYSGPAAGMYATKELELKDGVPSTVEGSVHAGEFTAMANLNINFGGGDIPANMHNMITGTINQFMDGDKELDFVINLLGDPTALTAVTATANRGTASATSASWSMAFFGPATDENGDLMPSGIAGVFDAHFPTGHVAGGFGATRK